MTNEGKHAIEEKDISSEAWREYDYGNGRIYRITLPIKLVTREGGSGHRVVDARGVVHWCPVNRWYILRWKSKEGKPDVRF